MSDVVVVIPCYNESTRLDEAGFRRFFDDPRVGLLFVDDGSTDDTRAVLDGLAARLGERAQVFALETNQGKAQAVRLGMQRAMDQGARVVGYADADLATPGEEMLRLAAVFAQQPDIDVVIGARVATLGTDIQRSFARHCLGRVFATAAVLVLGQRIYDTQCGAKLFRVDAHLRRALAEPFVSRWAFDVELLGRLLGAGQTVIEVPLRTWHDVPGSKLALGSMVRAGVDLLAIRRALTRWR